jgi:hypothetical protein
MLAITKTKQLPIPTVIPIPTPAPESDEVIELSMALRQFAGKSVKQRIILYLE